MSRSKHPLWNRWRHIMQVCYNSNAPDYIAQPAYWQPGEFWQFVNYVDNELGPQPSEKHRLTRKDLNGTFEPGNLEWSLPTEHCKRMPNVCVWVEYKDKLVNLKELARITGISYSAITHRYQLGLRQQDLWNTKGCIKR